MLSPGAGGPCRVDHIWCLFWSCVAQGKTRLLPCLLLGSCRGGGRSFPGAPPCREDKDVLGVFSKLKVLGVKLKDVQGKTIVIPQGSADALPW